MENNKKKNHFSSIMIIILISILLLIIVGFVYYNNNSKEKENGINNITFNGIYKNNNMAIWLYEDDNNVYYLSSLDYPMIYTRGKLKKENNKALGNLNITIYENSITVQNSNVLNGTYNKNKEITFEEFWNSGYGDTSLFNTKYNGKYESGINSVSIYQDSETEARVIINTSKEKVSYQFSISEHGSLMYFTNEYKWYVTYNKDDKNKVIIRKEKIGSNEEVYSYLLTKVSNINMKDVINSEVDIK